MTNYSCLDKVAHSLLDNSNPNLVLPSAIDGAATAFPEFQHSLAPLVRACAIAFHETSFKISSMFISRTFPFACSILRECFDPNFDFRERPSDLRQNLTRELPTKQLAIDFSAANEEALNAKLNDAEIEVFSK